MPIPLIIWAAGAVGAAYVAWKNKEKIEAFFDSEDGKKLLGDLNKAVEGHMEPYKKILDESYMKDSDERRLYFSAVKKRMSGSNWINLVGYGKSITNQNPKYVAVLADLLYIDRRED